jgi:hypothetical protein
VGVDFLKEIFYLNHSLISFALIELPNHPTSSCSNPFEARRESWVEQPRCLFCLIGHCLFLTGEYRELVEAD